MEDIKRYQWIKGDNLGELEILSESEGKFLVFKSGRRCNKNLVGEFVIEITHDSEILSIGNNEILNEPPKDVQKVSKKITGTKESISKSNPIIPILEKAKTKSIKLNIRIPMDLPPKEFISVLSESFDDNILDILSEYIISNIDNHREFLKEHSLKAIEDWYKKN
jgi:hypothetical protein